MDGSYATKGKCLHFSPNQIHNMVWVCVCKKMNLYLPSLIEFTFNVFLFYIYIISFLIISLNF